MGLPLWLAGTHKPIPRPISNQPSGIMGLLRTTINFHPSHFSTINLLRQTPRNQVEILGPMEGPPKVLWHRTPFRVDWLHSFTTPRQSTSRRLYQTYHCIFIQLPSLPAPFPSTITSLRLHPIPYLHHCPSRTCCHRSSCRIHLELGPRCEVCLGPPG